MYVMNHIFSKDVVVSTTAYGMGIDIEMEEFPMQDVYGNGSKNPRITKDSSVPIPSHRITNTTVIQNIQSNQNSNVIIEDDNACGSCFIGCIMGFVFGIFGICCICCVNDPMWYCIGCILPCFISFGIIGFFLTPIVMPFIITTVHQAMIVIGVVIQLLANNVWLVVIALVLMIVVTLLFICIFTILTCLTRTKTRNVINV